MVGPNIDTFRHTGTVRDWKQLTCAHRRVHVHNRLWPDMAPASPRIASAVGFLAVSIRDCGAKETLKASLAITCTRTYFPQHRMYCITMPARARARAYYGMQF